MKRRKAAALRIIFRIMGILPVVVLTMGAEKCKINPPGDLPLPPPVECPEGQVAVPSIGGKVRCQPVPPKPTPPPPGPTPTPVAGGDIPHAGWPAKPTANLPTLTDFVNAVLTDITGCPAQSDCPVADGGWANYDAFQVRFVKAMRAKGLRSGFHTEPSHPDETCTYARGAEECEAFKVATDGGKIKVAWAGRPSQPCYGGRDEHGFPAGLGCPGVGGGSYRGNWRSSADPPGPAPTPVDTPATPPPTTAAPALTKVLVVNASNNPNRPVFDATPKTCADPAWCAAHSTGGGCCPGGGEGDPAGRQAVEKAWGPWTWTLNGRLCAQTGRASQDGDCCEKDGGNDLRVVVPLGSLPPSCGNLHGATVRITGGNGVFGEIQVP